MHSVNFPFFYREFRILKNHGRGDQGFLVKIGDYLYRGLSTEGNKHRFLLVMYGFCSNNTLYSAGLSFMFTFLLTPFNT